MDNGILLSSNDARRIQNMLRWFEHGGEQPKYYLQGGVSGGGNKIRIFEVQSAATGDGVYNCYRQTLDATEWADTAGDDRFDDYDTTSVEVLNLLENNCEAGFVAQLAANDRMACWQWMDDEGTVRWVGIPIERKGQVRRAWCKAAAPASSIITCFLDVDTTGTEIQVYCSIIGGGHLDDAIPRLADGYYIFVTNIGGTWFCNTVFQRINDDYLKIVSNILLTNLDICP